MRAPRALMGLFAIIAGWAVPPLVAQSTLEQPPNLAGTWAGRPGTLYFNFLHRFDAGDPPARKVSNSPTFLLAAGLPARLLLGARYATSSVVASGYPNEWELFARWKPLEQAVRYPIDMAVSVAYNQAAGSVDGEVVAAREVGPVRLLALGRGFSDLFRTGEPGWAVGGGAVVRLTQHVSFAGDLAGLVGSPVPATSPFQSRNDELAWSLGLQLQIPYTPHTLSIQASNSNTTTLQGASFGVSPSAGEFLGVPYWGFEFTVPVTLSRYFGGGSRSNRTTQTEGPIAAEVTMTNRLTFERDTVRIRAGQAVRWRNTSDLIHTVTADPAKANDRANVLLPAGAPTFDSGTLNPGDVFVRTFRTPGIYRYFCIPHEVTGMVATVIVEEEA